MNEEEKIELKMETDKVIDDILSDTPQTPIGKVQPPELSIPEANDLRSKIIKKMQEDDDRKVKRAISSLTINVNGLSALDKSATESYVNSIDIAKRIAEPFLLKGFRAFYDNDDNELRIIIDRPNTYKRKFIGDGEYPRQELIFDSDQHIVVLGKKYTSCQ